MSPMVIFPLSRVIRSTAEGPTLVVRNDEVGDSYCSTRFPVTHSLARRSRSNSAVFRLRVSLGGPEKSRNRLNSTSSEPPSETYSLILGPVFDSALRMIDRV